MFFLAYQREWWEQLLGFPLIVLSIAVVVFGIRRLSRPWDGKEPDGRRIRDYFLVGGGLVGIGLGCLNILPVLG